MSSNLECFPDEVFKPIKGFESYLVSNHGRVYSLKRKKFIERDRHGYLGVSLYGKKRSGNKRDVYVHRLVAEAFIPNPKNLPEINHKDENKKNNSVENLEWCTGEYNLYYGTRIERSGIGHRKPVKVFEHGRLLGVFNSIKEASAQTGIDTKTISQLRDGKITHKKYAVEGGV